jgi:hypothetical protein
LDGKCDLLLVLLQDVPSPQMGVASAGGKIFPTLNQDNDNKAVSD